MTVVLIERKEQYSTLQPPTLSLCGMDGGLNRHACTTVRSNMSVLFVVQIHFGRNTASLRNIHTAPTAAQRWTEVTAIALWYEQEQMMDIGDMVTIFVVIGERKDVD